VEDAAPLSQLVFTIPGSDQVLHARIEAALCQSYQEADGIKLLSGIAARGAERKNGPDHFQTWNPNAGTHSGQYHVGRNLADDIADGPESLHVVQLVAVKAEIFLPFASISMGSYAERALWFNSHAADKRIVDVVLI
jgi:hypothetical protein